MKEITLKFETQESYDDFIEKVVKPSLALSHQQSGKAKMQSFDFETNIGVITSNSN